ncbi:MAG TPA: PQQ-binding-like beta-propeller repeat protein [Streptosporangiaceae bacterium]|nr:PQQ-binding-like beta-propeller repeat protein [Streptosporangiaceae bacterium]
MLGPRSGRWVRLAQVSERIGLLLVLNGVLATAAAPLVRWQSDYTLLATSGYSGNAGSGAVPMVLVFVLGPLASGWLVAARLPRRFFAEDRGYRRFGRSGWPIVTGALLCALGTSWSGGIPAGTRGPGAPLLAAGSAALVLGWLALAAGPRRSGAAPVTALPILDPPSESAPSGAAAGKPATHPSIVGPGRRAWVWAVTVALVATVIAGVMVSQVSVLQPVDHTTTAALPAIHLASPAAIQLNPAAPRWQTRTDSELVGPGVLAAGRYVVLTGEAGVTVLDARTGRERWHYLRRDARLSAAAVTADGQFLVVVMRRIGEFPNAGQDGLITGFGLATGQQPWQRSVAMPDQQVSAVAAGDTVATFALCAAGTGCGDVTAYDAASGELRWRWQAGTCGLANTTGAAAAMAAAVAPHGSQSSTDPAECSFGSIAVVTAVAGPQQASPGPPASPAGLRVSPLPGFAGNTEVPTVTAVPGGFLALFQERPRNGRGINGWAVARFGVDGARQGPLVPVGCAHPTAVEQVAHVFACVSAAQSGPRGWTVTAQGVDTASGAIAWRHEIPLPGRPYANPPYTVASGGVFYAGEESASGAWRSIAFRASDGESLGRAAGFEAASGAGLVIFFQPSSRYSQAASGRTTVTAFG